METKPNYGHDTEDPSKPRTEDVVTCEKVDFASMLLPSDILEGLHAANFKRPSPIQIKAIPLARCGFDLIVQAKSGTGKTLVFGLTALETVKTEIPVLQVLIVAPTREIALQIKDVLSLVGSNIKELKVKAFIGGIDRKLDKKEASGCHIAVVTPGRAGQLVENKILQVDNLRLLVLDEADKLMESSFSKDINKIIRKTSGSKQIILASATLCDAISKFVENHMNEPMRVTASGVQLLGDSTNDDVPRVLVGVKQFVGEVQAASNTAQQLRKKADKLVTILKGISFIQCVVFSNYQTRAESLCNMLTAEGWPAVSICGKQEQSRRTASVSAFKEFRCRILLSTDLTARGLDVHGVSLVVNLDIPYDSATYLHRMGRAGRFGATGTVITLVGNSEEMTKLRNLLFEIGGPTMAIHKLPADISKISDTNSLKTVVALPPEDHNANVEAEEESSDGATSPESSGEVSSEDCRSGSAKEPSSSELDGLCNALLETYLKPRSPLGIRSYEEIDSSRNKWIEGGASCTPPVLKKTDEKLTKRASAVLAKKSKRVEIPSKADEDVLRTVMETKWTDESRVSSEVDARSETEALSNVKSIPSPDDGRKKATKSKRKTVTVNLPESAKCDYSRPRSRKHTDSSFGQTSGHCENDQWGSRNDYYSASEHCHSSQWRDHYTQGDGMQEQIHHGYPSSSSQYYDHHRRYSEWYSNWEKQLSHIRFYVEYMEYWKNSYSNIHNSYHGNA